ncbi:MAG: T9SS type A sorting domain-containing protein [Bacteroidia bacterium]|nr:T9SS type A sorting domain-containing protein [Bacteroidia bacterium]
MKFRSKILFLFFSLITWAGGYSQNLVNNPSFEERDTCGIAGDCPTCFSLVCIATGWMTAKGTPDYFHACDTNRVCIFGGPEIGKVAVPKNAFGYQNAATGNAYAGFYTYLGYNPNNNNEREWLKCALISPLTIGEKYSISFKISLADSVNCASNNIGVLFSTVSLSYQVYDPQPNYSQFKTEIIVEDTSNWTYVSGEFIADSAYQYMMIGNFYDYSLSDSIFYPTRPVKHNLDSSECYAYYYFDDISVVADTINDISEYDIQYKISIFPNPINDKLIIEFDNTLETNVIIYNSIGQPIYQQSIFEKYIAIDLSLFANGIYLIQIYQNNQVFNKKVLIK